MGCKLPLDKTAVIALADGSFFLGKIFGYRPDSNYVLAECVFNTALTGYQEILSDPSYAEQAICFTNPHIGNVGINVRDMESDQPCVKALAVSSLASLVSNWRATDSLDNFCQQHKIMGITDIDTRALTHCLREKGAQSACFAVNMQPEQALALAAKHGAMQGQEIASKVAVKETANYLWPSGHLLETPFASDSHKHIVVLDYGVKQQMLRYLVDCGCKLTIMPGTTSAAEVLAHKPDGILLSNGPGDPAACTVQINTIKDLLNTNIPMFGICLGCQLLASALGAKTYKLVFGHHGANHPVLDCRSGKVLITSQNHGFAVSMQGLPQELIVTHKSLFDDSIQGFCHRSKPIFAVQGHPEACPGPQEWRIMFEEFIGKIAHAKA